jgi:hypothetical protein
VDYKLDGVVPVSVVDWPRDFYLRWASGRIGRCRARRAPHDQHDPHGRQLRQRRRRAGRHQLGTAMITTDLLIHGITPLSPHPNDPAQAAS